MILTLVLEMERKITILESDLDTNTGSTDQNDSIDREPLDRTYICDKPIRLL